MCPILTDQVVLPLNEDLGGGVEHMHFHAAWVPHIVSGDAVVEDTPELLSGNLPAPVTGRPRPSHLEA
jgi:hypothetical protein